MILGATISQWFAGLREGPRAALARVPEGNSSSVGSAARSAPTIAVGLHHLCLEVAERADLDLAVKRLRRLGATITDGPRHVPEYREGYHALSSSRNRTG